MVITVVIYIAIKRHEKKENNRTLKEPEDRTQSNCT